jgi:hypothetical protein
MRAIRLCSAIALAVVPALSAQRATGAKTASCSVRNSDPWVKRQAEWFDDSKHDWTNDSLRTALLQAAGIAAPLVSPVQLGVQIDGRDPALGPTADEMVAQLKKLVAARGSTWPTRSVVGAAGTHAVYLLAQRDTGFGRAVLHRMMEAGPSESPSADVATFEDHLRLVWGRKQIYGTRFRVDGAGKVILAPMEDSAHADLRREDAWLPPFKVGLCLARRR